MERVHPALLCSLDDEGEPEMADTRLDLLMREYEAVNAHLRANIGQFVNWFRSYGAVPGVEHHRRWTHASGWRRPCHGRTT